MRLAVALSGEGLGGVQLDPGTAVIKRQQRRQKQQVASPKSTVTPPITARPSSFTLRTLFFHARAIASALRDILRARCVYPPRACLNAFGPSPNAHKRVLLYYPRADHGCVDSETTPLFFVERIEPELSKRWTSVKLSLSGIFVKPAIV